jgi:PII-like signaling protein
MEIQDTKFDPNDHWMLMRIFIGESDKAAHGKFKGRPLWEALLNDFRERELAGCTVIRAIAGFGASAKARNILSEYLSSDLPIIIEVVDRESKIRKVMPDLEEMIGGGMVTLEKVDVVLYRSQNRDYAD